MNPSITSMLAAALIASGAPAPLAGQSGLVKGNLTLKDKGGKLAADVTDAIVWLDGGPPARPHDAEIVTRDKQLIPSVVVVAPGSSVAFPNHDPFNHNVFSLSPEAVFDLGLFGRGDSRSMTFSKPGLVRIYCNIHAQMWAVVMVLATGWVARPGPDGTWQIPNVPPGSYTMTAWHERGGQVSQPLVVGAAGNADVRLALDASGFKPKPHTNKLGKPYQSEGRRY